MFWRIAAILFGIWLGGYLAFTQKLLDTPISSRKTDAVVALTGGEGRLERALLLLERGKAKRLLVSGVHRATSERDLRRRTRSPKKLFDCCVDLGHAAGNTIGNAVEASVWMETHRFRSLRLVTSRAHMPRARLEFETVMPNVEIVPEAVDTDNSIADRVAEYNKYAARLILLRTKQL